MAATLSTPPISPPTKPRGDRVLSWFAWAVLGWNVLVVIWGALVRATDSGAGCGNHWPLCNGDVIPVSPTLHTIIEFTHRVTNVGSVVVLIPLAILTFRRFAKPHPARRAVITSVIFLVIEALLGALLVKLGYVTTNRSMGRVVMFSIHFANTLLYLAALTVTAWLISGRRLGKIPGLGWLVLAATMAVGISGSLAALGDTLFPASSLRAAFAQDVAVGAPMILRLRGVHPLSVLVATGLMLWLVSRFRPLSPATRTLSTVVLCLLGLQIAAGLTDLVLLAPVWMQLIHLLLADLYWIAALLFVSAASAAVDHPEVSHP